MKDKRISILYILLIITAVVCVIYIVVSSTLENKKDSNTVDEENVESEEKTVNERTQRSTNIIVSSRVGLKLRDYIDYLEIYSEDITKELDTNGLTTKSKILISTDRIARKSEYQSYMEYSESYGNSYITAANMKKVIESTFTDSNYSDETVTDYFVFNPDDNVYVILPSGNESGSLNYTVDVPYKITEYSDRIEMLAYRVYITKVATMQEAVSQIKNDIYQDRERTKIITTLSDDELTVEPIDGLKKLIDEKVINPNNLECVKYTFNDLHNGEYTITDFEKVNYDNN